MKTVYTTSSFVPMELIAACGCVPRRLGGDVEARRLSQTEGTCPFTEAWLGGLLEKAKTDHFAAVFATTCDQMRRAYDLYGSKSKQPAFLLNVPATLTPQGLDYFRQELERLQRFLCDFGGMPFDKDQLKTLMTAPLPDQSSANKFPLNIALVGESVLAAIYDGLNAVLKLSHAGISLNLTEEPLSGPLGPSKDTAVRDPLGDLARRLFYRPAVWRRPNHAFYRALTQRLGRDDIHGLIVLRYVFCDHWHSAVYELKKRLAVPVLQIDLDGSDALPASVVSRVQAFTEMLTT
jgi:benzoyl-CoA reductase/2-hydroxyglutaryl-CoA dehydratase subunit BcrC/BadD/HgdB